MFILALYAATRQDNFPDVPANRWAFDGLRVAVREGLLPEKQGTLIGYVSTLRLHSRYEVAVMIHVAATIQRGRTEKALDGGASGLERAALIRERTLLTFYRRGAKEFAREFTSLGITDDLGVARLDALGDRLARQSPPIPRPFDDVPADHWAAKAVGDLRALGLLDGYPDQTFKG